jgi:hypothetical protein
MGKIKGGSERGVDDFIANRIHRRGDATVT